jgi:uncharacterized membrane protein YfcA
MLSAQAALGVVLALSFAGFMQGLTGFGFGLAAVALLPLLVGLKDAQVVISLLNAAVCATIFLATWRHFRWRDGRGLVIGAGIGVPIGFWTLTCLPESLLLRALGLLLCVFSLGQLCRGRRGSIRIPSALGLPFGFFSGYLGGALNVGGPPAIAYAYSQPWSKEQAVSLLQVVFGVSALLRLTLFVSSNLIRPEHLRVSLLTLAPMLAATWCGKGLLERVPREKLKIGVFVFLLVMGVKYLFFTSR